MLIAKKHAPVASRTALGWVVHGSAPSHNKTTASLTVITMAELDDKEKTDYEYLHALVKQTFSIEALGINRFDRVNKKNERATLILEQSTRRVVGGWETGLLRKSN